MFRPILPGPPPLAREKTVRFGAEGRRNEAGRKSRPDIAPAVRAAHPVSMGKKKDDYDKTLERLQVLLVETQAWVSTSSTCSRSRVLS